MLCDICQTRQAKIFYTEIVNGQKKEQHLCEQCASEYTAVPINDILGGQGLSSIGSILSGILSSYSKAKGKSLSSEKRGEAVCPECGTSESEFLKTGRTGCPVCYNVFRDMIAKNFKTMQGGMTHTGKEPAFAKFIQIDEAPVTDGKNFAGNLEQTLNLDPDDEMIEITENKSKKKTAAKEPSAKAPAAKPKDTDKLESLRQKLKNAIAEEDYELAAKLRDEIKKTEKPAKPGGDKKPAKAAKPEKTVKSEKAAKTVKKKKPKNENS